MDKYTIDNSCLNFSTIYFKREYFARVYETDKAELFCRLLNENNDVVVKTEKIDAVIDWVQQTDGLTELDEYLLIKMLENLKKG